MKKLAGLGEKIQKETKEELKKQGIVLKGSDVYVNGKRVKGNSVTNGTTIVVE